MSLFVPVSVFCTRAHTHVNVSVCVCVCVFVCVCVCACARVRMCVLSSALRSDVRGLRCGVCHSFTFCASPCRVDIETRCKGVATLWKSNMELKTGSLRARRSTKGPLLCSMLVLQSLIVRAVAGPLGSKVPEREVYRVSIIGIVIMASGIYFTFGYLDPWVRTQAGPQIQTMRNLHPLQASFWFCC